MQRIAVPSNWFELERVDRVHDAPQGGSNLLGHGFSFVLAYSGQVVRSTGDFIDDNY